jgi:hypothetical protein
MCTNIHSPLHRQYLFQGWEATLYILERKIMAHLTTLWAIYAHTMKIGFC